MTWSVGLIGEDLPHASNRTPLSSLEAVVRYCEGRRFKGYDPYDALNSPILRLISLGLKYPRIAVTQALKRLPFNIRPLLLIPKGYNPKGLGLFLWSYTKLYQVTGDQECLAKIDLFLDLLDGLKNDRYGGHGWGYNFNWQSRAFYVPKGTPTVVNSSFVGHALLDAWAVTGKQKALELAVPIGEFIEKGLNRTKDGDTECISYTPIDHLIVHNANLLGASLLARLQQHEPVNSQLELAHRALNYSMKYQRDDGSWWYADTSYQQWIDSFHTGFNLQCIKYFLDLDLAPEHREGYQAGVRFYAENFFEPDGTAKYFHDRREPIDIHSYAQAIVFFSIQGGYPELVDRVTRRFIETMQDPRGYFWFQIRNGKANRIPYMRWSQSWSMHALTQYLFENRPSQT